MTDNLKFNIEKITINAKSRTLKSTWLHEILDLDDPFIDYMPDFDEINEMCDKDPMFKQAWEQFLNVYHLRKK